MCDTFQKQHSVYIAIKAALNKPHSYYLQQLTQYNLLRRPRVKHFEIRKLLN